MLVLLYFNSHISYFRNLCSCSDVDSGVAPGDDHGAVELPGPAPDVDRGLGPGQQRVIGRVEAR